MRLVLIALLFAAASAAAQSVSTVPVAFEVTNPQEPFRPRTVRGTAYFPPQAPACDQTAVLLLHGLSYASWAWDFPAGGAQYSMARALAARGYVAVTVDELGYGRSDHPNGWNLSVTSYGAMTAQLVRKLQSGAYQSDRRIAYSKVVLFGHSAGTEMAELAAGLHGAADGLIASAYSHFPSTGILLDVLTGDTPRALLSPYVYFGGDAVRRAQYMYDAQHADPAVIDADTRLAELTPSGEILTIGNQPSRPALPLIRAPSLVLMAENDILFPPAPAELLLFTSSADKTYAVVPDAGHSFMLHLNAGDTQQRVGEWLQARFPSCAEW